MIAFNIFFHVDGNVIDGVHGYMQLQAIADAGCHCYQLLLVDRLLLAKAAKLYGHGKYLTHPNVNERHESDDDLHKYSLNGT